MNGSRDRSFPGSPSPLVPHEHPEQVEDLVVAWDGDVLSTKAGNKRWDILKVYQQSRSSGWHFHSS